MIALADFDPRPGRLVEWRVSASTAGRRHPAPASANQEAHLAAHLRTPPAARASRWYGAAVDLPGPPDPAALGTAVRSFAARHDVLRSSLTPTPGGLTRRLLPASALSVAPVDHGWFRTGPEAAHRLGALFDRGTDPARWPAYRFAAVLREDGATLLTAFDHSVTDVYSLVLSVDELTELHAAAVVGRPPALPVPGSFLDHCVREAAVSPGDLARARELWRAVLGPPGAPAMRLPIDVGAPPGVPLPLRSEEFVIAGADTAERFEQRCRRSGAGVLAGLLAALAADSGLDRFRIVVPLHTREDATADAMGWFVNGLPISVDVPPDRDADTLIAGADRALRTARAHRLVPAERVLAGVSHRALDRPVSWLSYVDTRRFAGSRRHEAQRAHVLTGRRTGEGVDLWVTRTWSGLYALVRSPDTEVARREVRRYAASLARAVARVGGDTPVLHGRDRRGAVAGQVAH